MEYDILMFLHNNPQHNTAAEIVKVRKSTKSHVSTSLKKLENEGLIERIQSENNKKHIEIVLLDKAELIVEAGINAQNLVLICILPVVSQMFFCIVTDLIKYIDTHMYFFFCQPA